MARLTDLEKKRLIQDIMIKTHSVRELAKKYSVSNATVQKYKEEVDPETERVIQAGVAYKQGLSGILDEHKVNAIVNAVDERTRHIMFFNNATEHNISVMLAKVSDETSIMEHRIAQAAIKDGKEVVLGKSPETAIQINNGDNQATPAINARAWLDNAISKIV